MKPLLFDYQHAKSFISDLELESIQNEISAADQLLKSKTGPGNSFLGWESLPEDFDKAEFQRIKIAAKRIQNQSEILIVIGIGGSYLGAKAAIDFLAHSFHNELSKEQRKAPQIYFAGINLSGQYLLDLLDLIGEKDFSINMISKSGTTTEPAIAFRVLKDKLIKKYGKEEASKRIYATTDQSKGALKQLAQQEGYEQFVVPDDVGGRFSVLTAVGLLPIAALGLDIDALMEGALAARIDSNQNFETNDCHQYVALRNLLYRKGKQIEMLINYQPKLQNIAEWWKQLFGESEGKDGKGIFPASANFTADLHSLGQYIQDGHRHIFETCISFGSYEKDIVLKEAEGDLDGLNYLSGKTIEYVNEKAAQGTLQAHVEGGVPNLKITLAKADAYHLGYLFYFFEKACALSGYVLAVNPFDQPGVEAYKKKMFQLLGKPGAS